MLYLKTFVFLTHLHGQVQLDPLGLKPVAHGQYLTSMLRSQESGGKEHPDDFS